jgi:outer membrane immunogenic protein
MSMLKTAILGAGCLAAAINAAQAADTYGRSKTQDVPVYAPAAIWSGVYVGINAGATVSDEVTARINELSATASADAAGLFGGQLGVNYQMGNLVLGLEADITGSGAELVSFIGTVRGRAGYAMDRTLIYVTGGIASLEWDLGEFIEGGYSTGGWVLGAGVEHKFTPSLSLGVEALHYSFSDSASDEMVSVELDRDMWAIRGRLNYHMNVRGGDLK